MHAGRKEQWRSVADKIRFPLMGREYLGNRKSCGGDGEWGGRGAHGCACFAAQAVLRDLCCARVVVAGGAADQGGAAGGCGAGMRAAGAEGELEGPSRSRVEDPAGHGWRTH
jgi:hypothetical protein